MLNSILIKILQRKTNNSKLIPEIDGLRFYAIFTVVIYHLNTSFSKQIGAAWRDVLGDDHAGHLGWWLIRMDMGVQVFFVISGFILSLPFLKHYLLSGPKINLKEYFIRRLTRLEPPFIITLLVFYAVHVMYLNADAIYLLPHLGANLIYAHSFIYAEPSLINPVTWSLETEAQFYLVIPFLITLFFLSKKKVVSLFIVVVFIAISVYFKPIILFQGPMNLAYSIIIYLINFLFGFLFAWFYLKQKDWLLRKGFFWDVIGLISVFAMFLYYKPQLYRSYVVLFNVSTFMMFIAVFKGRLTNWFYSRPIIYVIGGMCYTIYLLHFAFFHLVVKFTSSLITSYGYAANLFIQFLVTIPMLMIISITFFLLIEKPCMDKNWPTKAVNFIKAFLKLSPLK